MKKRILSIIVAVCIGMISFAAFEMPSFATDTYLARAVLGTTNNLDKIGIATAANQMDTVVTKGGRQGYTSSLASEKYYLPFNVYSSVLYDVPMYTPIDITVDYYDEGTGFFGLQYNIQPEHANANYFTTGNTVAGGEGMCVELTDTETWKSYTFHIEDGKFADGLGSGATQNRFDFRLAVWDPIRGKSPSDVVFGGVTVSASEFSSLVDYDYLQYTQDKNVGNIFAATDTITFTQDIENKKSESVVSKYSWVITNESGQTVGTYNGQNTLASRATATRNITIDNPETYGIYTIHVTEENYTEAAPNDKYISTYTEEFSVCISLSNSNADPNFGFNQSVVRGLGNYRTAGGLMHNAGATWNRESIMWVGVESTTTKGDYNISDANIQKLQKMKDDGVNVVAVLTGRHELYGNGGTSNPYTDDDITAFANFCAYCAERLNGVVDHFEIWNEWNSGSFNPTGRPPEDYAKLLKASYTAIKNANPDAFVIGCDAAGFDSTQRTWISRVLTALNDGTGNKYMDAVSVHCYDYDSSTGFPESQFVANTEALKALLDEKGYGQLPLWLTEIGFSTYDNPDADFFVDGCTDEVQLNSMVMMSAINKAYGLFDHVQEYCLYDMSNESLISANWGVLNCWTRDYTHAVNRPEEKLVPSGAKPAYLGIAAMNYFIGGGATFVDMQKNGRCYAFEFHNNNLDNNVILAINGGFNNNQTQEFDLDCESINIYDKYGNLKQQMSSETGVYSINTYSEPIYIVGNIENSEVHHEGILVNASVDRTTNLVTITGNTSEANDSVTVMILTDGPAMTSYDPNRVVYLEQTQADANGDFTVVYEADSLTGEYQIYVNSINKKSVVVKDLVFSYTTPKLSVTQNGETVTDITELSTGDRPVVKLTGYQTTNEVAPKIMIAQYDGEQMIDVKTVTARGDFTELGSEFTTDFTVATGADSIKVMYWDEDSMSPLAPYCEIN